MENIWSNDDVQTARILFYLWVIPFCIEHLPTSEFRKVVAPTMFLYMGHPNGKVATASHSMFVAFISSGKDLKQEDRASLKEQLVFYYMQRSLEGHPGITRFEGMASGVAAIVQHLPSGSPSIFYCIHGLVEKASRMCNAVNSEKTELQNTGEGNWVSCQKMLELLLLLLSLVNIQEMTDELLPVTGSALHYCVLFNAELRTLTYSKVQTPKELTENLYQFFKSFHC